jgi:hypothetical protein
MLFIDIRKSTKIVDALRRTTAARMIFPRKSGHNEELVAV